MHRYASFPSNGENEVYLPVLTIEMVIMAISGKIVFRSVVSYGRKIIYYSG
ncbi:MAG: hypothetical protein ACP5IB_07620 [Thermoplasmata archaeon]